MAEYEDYELQNKREKVCGSCGFAHSCSERNKLAPACRLIAKLYNTKKEIKRGLRKENEK